MEQPTAIVKIANQRKIGAKCFMVDKISGTLASFGSAQFYKWPTQVFQCHGCFERGRVAGRARLHPSRAEQIAQSSKRCGRSPKLGCGRSLKLGRGRSPKLGCGRSLNLPASFLLSGSAVPTIIDTIRDCGYGKVDLIAEKMDPSPISAHATAQTREFRSLTDPWTSRVLVVKQTPSLAIRPGRP